MATLALDPILDMEAAAPLKQALLDVGPGVLIDAGAVERIASPCLQILVAAVREGARIDPVSNILRDTARRLALMDALGIAP